VNVCLCSAFRDSDEYLARYFGQAAALRDALAARGDALRLALVYGDCKDGTAGGLRRHVGNLGLAADVVEHSHGNPDRGHTQNPARFRALAGVATAMLRAAPEESDALVYAESDLIWTPDAILALLDDLERPEIALAFPMLMINQTRRFYDIWAYRVGNTLLNPYWPFHPALANGHRYVELTGAGSCAAMLRPAFLAARRLGFPPWDCWPGLVRALAVEGFRSWVDTQVTVWHPNEMAS
jgi:hypothetical protein